VNAFYEEFSDSLPTRVAAVRMSDILYTVEVSKATLDSVRHQAEIVLDSIQAGADFALMAQQYSDDPSASDGGDLGWFGRNVMVPAFERAAFGLAIGEVSGIVPSRFGFHLIKSLDRRGDRVHAAHILFRASPSDSDLAFAEADVAQLRERHLAGEDFATLAKQYSADSATAVAGGDLGWIPLASLPEPFASAVADQPAGAVFQLTADDGVHLIKIAERRDERPYDLALDRAEITELARRQKTGRVVEEWVSRLRDEIYVEVRL
jgi:peptidyl-prolyl cis-trans isomerase SurA